MSGPAGRIAALVGEPPADVPPAAGVLLVPGYTGSKEDFLPILAPLARAGRRAVAIDLPGQFESAGPDDPQAYSLDALAKTVTGLLADLGSGAHLVGHSFGGLVTRRAVVSGATPASLTMLGSGPAGLGGRRGAVVVLMRELLADQGAAALEVMAEASERDDPRVAAADAGVRDFLRRRWLGNSPVGLSVMGQDLLTADDETVGLTGTAVPVLVLHGAGDDAWTPAEQAAMAKRLGSAYVVIDDADHSPACESPAATVEALLAFWAGVEGR
ncbi:MAG: alpha/beta fold hydrolase [Frankiales bacterium]|nr:alpha/beta fold hydrolase [Frankiales bacterium]